MANGRAIGSPAITDQRGAYQVSLPAGEYSLTVNADGFQELSRTITVPVTNHAADFVLAIAGVRETVAVKGVPAEPVTIIRSATKTPTPLLDTPQSVTVVSQTQIRDQQMLSIGDVMRYVPGIAVHQGENNRDQIIIRGNSTSADFFVNGVRDDVQYYRDLYNLSRVEALKGPNALIFGRGGAGGVVNRVGKEAGFEPLYEVSLQGGMYGNKRVTTDVDHSLGANAALRVNGMFEDSDSFRDQVGLTRYGVTPTLTFLAEPAHQDRRRLRVPQRPPRRRSRHHVVPGQAARHRSRHLLRQPGRQPRRRRRESRSRHGGASGRQADRPQPHRRWRATTAPIRTTCPAR